jgi:hypothetical protein
MSMLIQLVAQGTIVFNNVFVRRVSLVLQGPELTPLFTSITRAKAT